MGPLRLELSMLALSGQPREEIEEYDANEGCCCCCCCWCWPTLFLPDETLQLLLPLPLLLLLLAPSDDEVEVDCDDCGEPKISENDTFSSIGDGSPRLMISLCSKSRELIECFCSISGPVSDRAISGLGQSLKLVCCSEGISPTRYSVSFPPVCVFCFQRPKLLPPLSRRALTLSLTSLFFTSLVAAQTLGARQHFNVLKAEFGAKFPLRSVSRRLSSSYSQGLLHSSSTECF